jgi:hypothetical protein
MSIGCDWPASVRSQLRAGMGEQCTRPNEKAVTLKFNQACRTVSFCSGKFSHPLTVSTDTFFSTLIDFKTILVDCDLDIYRQICSMSQIAAANEVELKYGDETSVELDYKAAGLGVLLRKKV